MSIREDHSPSNDFEAREDIRESLNGVSSDLHHVNAYVQLDHLTNEQLEDLIDLIPRWLSLIASISKHTVKLLRVRAQQGGRR